MRKDIDSSEIKSQIVKNLDAICQSLQKGKDIEIRGTANGISITEVGKKIVFR